MSLTACVNGGQTEKQSRKNKLNINFVRKVTNASSFAYFSPKEK